MSVSGATRECFYRVWKEYVDEYRNLITLVDGYRDAVAAVIKVPPMPEVFYPYVPLDTIDEYEGVLQQQHTMNVNIVIRTEFVNNDGYRAKYTSAVVRPIAIDDIKRRLASWPGFTSGLQEDIRQVVIRGLEPDKYFTEYVAFLRKFTPDKLHVYMLCALHGRPGIAELIELYKDVILESPLHKRTGGDPIQFLVTRHGLRPASKYMKWADCCKLIGVNCGDVNHVDAQSDPHSDPQAYVDQIAAQLEAAGHPTNVVLICRSSGMVVEYDADPMLAPAGLNTRSGLNKAAIRRYSTISVHNSLSTTSGVFINAPKPKYGAIKPNVIVANREFINSDTVVLETQNMVHFRFLVARYVPAVCRLTGEQEDVPEVSDRPFTAATGFVPKTGGSAADPRVVESTAKLTGMLGRQTLRAVAYQLRQEKIIQTKCFNPTNRLVIDKYLAMRPLHADAWVDMISRAIEQDFDEAGVTTDDEFTQYVARATGVFRGVLFREISKSFTMTPELEMTYIAKFEPTLTDFARLFTSMRWSVAGASGRVTEPTQNHAHYKSLMEQLIRAIMTRMQKNQVFNEIDISLKDFILEENVITM